LLLDKHLHIQYKTLCERCHILIHNKKPRDKNKKHIKKNSGANSNRAIKISMININNGEIKEFGCIKDCTEFISQKHNMEHRSAKRVIDNYFKHGIIFNNNFIFYKPSQ